MSDTGDLKRRPNLRSGRRLADRSERRIVVIGAGMGGLASAIRLAAAGQSVTVLERAATPGGKMRTLPSAIGPVDAGPTVLTMRPVFEDLFAAAGQRLSDHVTLQSEPLLARHFWSDGSTLDLFADPDASAAAVHSFAGLRAEQQFRAFSAEAALLFNTFDAPMMQTARPSLGRLAARVMTRPRLIPALLPGATLAKSLERHFTDPRLRQLFGRYATYVGGSPYASPAVLGLIWQSEARGIWRVEGGMHQLAVAMARVAETLGVQINYNADVERIERDRAGVSGVLLTNGRRIRADTVVFNGDPRALSLGLLGDKIPRAKASSTEPRSLSAYVWSFSATPSGVDLAHHNVFFGDAPRDEFDPLAQGKMPLDPTLYVCAEDRGTGRSPQKTERFEIIMNAPPLRDDHTAPAPKTEFETCATRTFDRLQAMGLAFSPSPTRPALTTPRDFATLFPGSAGSLYGRSPHGLMAAFQRPTARTALRGLYLAGGGAHPGAGIPMATLSGQHAAEAIWRDRTLRSKSRRTATPGGMSTESAPAAPTLSRSSPS